MSERIDLSVVLCTCNRAGRLKRTIESLCQASGPQGVEYEILVVDNRSTDNTRGVIGAFARESHRLRYVLETVRGVTSARNRGIREARGEIIAFLDDDVEVSPRWMHEVIRAFEDPSKQVIQGRIRLRLEGARPPWFSAKCEELLAMSDEGEETRPLQRYLISANAAFRRGVFDRVGYFNPTLGPGRSGYNDDVDLSKRLRAAGIQEWYAPGPWVEHVVFLERLSKRAFFLRCFRQGVSDAHIKPIGDRGLRWLRLVLYYLKEGFRDRFGASPTRIPPAFERSLEAYRKWGYAWAHLQHLFWRSGRSSCGS